MAHEGDGYVVPTEVRDDLQDIAEFLKQIAPRLSGDECSLAHQMAGRLDAFARGPGGTFEIEPIDLLINVWGHQNERRVEIIHTPTGLSADATDKSQLRAKDRAMDELRKLLQARAERPAREQREQEYPS